MWRTLRRRPCVRANIEREARIATDEAGQYKHLHKDFAEHVAVNHNADEWSRGEFHTNTVEGYYSVFKRGMKGVYQALLREASAPLPCRVRF